MFRLLACGLVLTLAALTAGAQDKKPEDKKDAPKDATWVREVEGIELQFTVGKEEATFVVIAAGNSVTIKSKVTWDKDTVKAEFTDIKVQGEFPNEAKKGDKVSFKWVVKGDVATLSEFKGDNAEGAKGV
ncbi:MAG: hypothetical protein K2V38_07655, partial [Gemmataceae bacterium]|nr:hypothetical protein [Gemmataceae bacterium]